MIAQVSGLEAGELVHIIADCHIYDRHVDIVRKMLDNPMYDAPEFIMDKTITNFYDFTVDSFHFENYQYTNLDTKFPVAI